MFEGLLHRSRNPIKRAEYEAELACPPFPAALDYLWRVFHRLRRRKGGNGFSVSPIEWPDIDAFVRNSQTPLSAWEVEVIEDLDDAFLSETAKAGKSEQEQPQ